MMRRARADEIVAVDQPYSACNGRMRAPGSPMAPGGRQHRQEGQGRHHPGIMNAPAGQHGVERLSQHEACVLLVGMERLGRPRAPSRRGPPAAHSPGQVRTRHRSGPGWRARAAGIGRAWRGLGRFKRMRRMRPSRASGSTRTKPSRSRGRRLWPSVVRVERQRFGQGRHGRRGNLSALGRKRAQ